MAVSRPARVPFRLAGAGGQPSGLGASIPYLVLCLITSARRDPTSLHSHQNVEQRVVNNNGMLRFHGEQD